jgi:hypothetical protein
MSRQRRTLAAVLMSLAWWLVLVAYRPSRPWAMFEAEHTLFGDHRALATSLRVAYSLAYVLGAGALAVLAIRRWHLTNSLPDLINGTVFLSWFSVASWCWASLLLVLLSGRVRAEDLALRAFTGVSTSLIAPVFAHFAYWEATWPLLALSALTMLLLRCLEEREPADVRAHTPLEARRS